MHTTVEQDKDFLMMQAPKNFRPEPYEYHEELTLRVEDLTNLGRGIARDGDWVVQVAHVLPGETIKARVYRNHKSYSVADCIEVLESSPERVEPVCPLYSDCGGCQYQHVSYKAQLEWKQRHVKESMNRIGGVDIEVLPVFPSPKPYGYRSKLTPHFQKDKDGEIGAIGFLRQGSRRAILDVPQCPIATEGINAALTEARQNLRSTWKRKKGGTLLLRDTQEGVTTDSQAIVSETVNDLVFQFKAGEFFQNNSFLLPEMVSHVVSEAEGEGLECLVDAYCGGGLFALSAAKRFARVMGVEISRDGFDWARANAVVNRIENCEFLLGNASEIFAEVNISGESCSLVVDPPRKGCGDDFLRQALAFGPARIIYVSCDPSTQARDSQYLIEGGYAIVKAQPFDLFPQTRHVENVLTFVKESPSSHEANP